MNEVYQALARAAGVDRPAEYGPARPGEQRRSALGWDRARQLLDWAPTTPLDRGLAETVAWSRAHDGGS